MFDYIIGKITYANEGKIVVENNGIGYVFSVSNSSMVKLSNEEGDVKVYTYMAVREDNISLYAFSDTLERDLFLMLITVPKVGPKVALNLLSLYTPKEAIYSIRTSDTKSISAVSGIGKKTAEQIVFNLKDKFDDEEISFELEEDNFSESLSVKDDALSALIALGFDRVYCTKLINDIEIDEDMTAEEVITLALSKVNI